MKSKTKQRKPYHDLLLANDEQSYESWLSNNGNEPQAVRLTAEAEAEAEALRGSPSYGSKAQALKSRGLLGGYVDYLKSQAEKIKAENEANAYERSVLSDLRNTKGYENYLKTYNTLQNKIQKSVIDKLSERLCFDPYEAYRFAVSSGLSEENALYVSASGVRQAMQKVTEDTIAYVKEKGMSASMARNYAASLGLSGRYAQLVANSVKAMSEEEEEYYSSLSTEEYIKLLQEKKAEHDKQIESEES